MKDNKSSNVLLIIAILAVLLSFVNLIIVLTNVENFFTGYATATGTANLTILSQASLTFTVTSIDWGSGAVNESETFAYLDSEGNTVNGNWTAVSQGLVLRNDGNSNISLSLTASNDADGFIGGTSPSYKIKLSDSEAGSCTVNQLSSYTEVTGAAQSACGNFSYEGSDEVRIDVNITVPKDAEPGAKGSVITAEGVPL